MTQPHTNPTTEHEALREAIETGVLGFVWSTGDATAVADAVLALPEVAALRAKADAADRVRKEAIKWRAGGEPGVAAAFLRALDADDRPGQR